MDANQIDEEAASELVKRSAVAGVTARVESVEHGAIGIRRRSSVGKLVMGGAAQRILLEASVPVLPESTSRRSRH